jgi:hypothetical protein
MSERTTIRLRRGTTVEKGDMRKGVNVKGIPGSPEQNIAEINGQIEDTIGTTKKITKANVSMRMNERATRRVMRESRPKS